MESINQLPEWFGTAVLGAIIAATGYVAKLIIELYRAYKERYRQRRSKLVELQSLLNATSVAFEIQNKQAQNLTDRIEKNYPEVSKNLTGYEDHISRAYNHLNAEDRELHAYVRSITVNTVYGTNKSMLKWIRKDDYFRSAKSGKKIFAEFALQLTLLESHLILWLAKYEAWIPDHPEHALIYMADEKGHGLGFPSAIDDLIGMVLKKY